MGAPVTIVWFRQDLRLADNLALHAAAARGVVVPLFVWAPDEDGDWPVGAAGRWWLHQSLRSLAASLAARGAPLILRRGPTRAALTTLIGETGATALYWNRRYEPAAIARDTRIKSELSATGVECASFNGALLQEPWDVQTREGMPYRVFTPFYRACLARTAPPAPLAAPRKLRGIGSAPRGSALDDLRLEPRIDWAGGLRAAWEPGEGGAAKRLREFIGPRVAEYPTDRDLPSVVGTSLLSPHLHWGESSPRQVWQAVAALSAPGGAQAAAIGASAYLRELIWREFAHHLLYHFPHTTNEPLRPAFAAFPWQPDATLQRAWQRGETGYPLVDAGMRQLWHTGWMHNRVRMVVASFFVKHLLQPWQDGARWFWDTLVDADLANNTLGWQWTAGCGADAAPFFRIFNPTAQAEKFDPRGEYQRQWVPELAGAPNRQPYPAPIVEHAAARAGALRAFEKIRAPID